MFRVSPLWSVPQLNSTIGSVRNVPLRKSLLYNNKTSRLTPPRQYPLQPPLAKVIRSPPSNAFRLFTTKAFEDATASQNGRTRRGLLSKLLPAAVVLIPSSYLYLQYFHSPNQLQEELENTEKLYSARSTPELLFSLFILKMCSFDSVVEYGPRLLKFAESHHLARLAHWLVKKTFFRNFVAGETLEECTIVVDKLKKLGMGVILDYSIESGTGTKEDFDRVADSFITTIHMAAKEPNLSFACLKVSGLSSYALMARITSLLQYYQGKPSLPVTPSLESPQYPAFNTIESFSTRPLPPCPPPSSPPPPLSASELSELNDLVARMERICKIAYESNVSLLVDAEQTYYQPAIDLFTLYLCKKFNQKRPIVYNTYQMYLRDSPNRLAVDIENAKKEGYFLGVKLVRGAYMYTERKRAQELGYNDPINPTIEDTHAWYHQGLELALNNIDTVGVMIASHNQNSIIHAISRVRDLQIDPANPNLQFAQLYGMGDHLSLLLVQNGQRIFKYVPFGPVHHVIPYLIRRMQENRGFIGSTSAKERELLWREIKRRVFFWPQTIGGTVNLNNAK